MRALKWIGITITILVVSIIAIGVSYNIMNPPGPTSSQVSEFRGDVQRFEIYGDGTSKIYVDDTPLDALFAAANQGDVLAQRRMGSLLWRGANMSYNQVDPLPQDQKSAVAWYESAANAGDMPSQYYTALAYDHGDGVNKDPQQARYYYEQAAAQNHGPAMNKLGYYQQHGLGGLEVNLLKSVEWYRRASHAGDLEALTNLGIMYLNGDGVAQNFVEAVSAFRSAAQQQYPTGYFLMGHVYHNGLGVDQDLNQATTWYQRAAEEGHEQAQQRLQDLRS